MREPPFRTPALLCVALLIGCGSNDERPAMAESTGSTAAASVKSGQAPSGTPNDESVRANLEGAAEGADPEGAGKAMSVRGTSAPEALDLREANVTAVEYDAKSGRFDVTLIHDDAGEPAYANWWQVEKLDGTLLGRRELLHGHGTQEFTRSQTIDVPAGVEWVVVRGHDPTHGYGGQAIVFNVKTGEGRKVDQGPEKQDFGSYEP